MTQPTEPTSYFASADPDEGQPEAEADDHGHTAHDESPDSAGTSHAFDADLAADHAGDDVAGPDGHDGPAAPPTYVPPAASEPTREEPAYAGLGAGLDLQGGYDPGYTPSYYTGPAEPSWSSDRLEAIMRDTIDAQAQEQRQLEQLLADVRTALRSMPSPDQLAAGSDLGPAIEALRSDIAAARDSQSSAHAELSTRLDSLAATPETPGQPSLQDVHDGLAGVRTDVTALPDLVVPAVTSAISTALAGGGGETHRQVLDLHDTVKANAAEAQQQAAQVVPLLTEIHEQLAPLAGLADTLRELSDRVAALESRQDEGPDVGAVLDDRLATHLGALGAGVGERMDSLEAQHAGVREDMTALRLSQEGPSGVAPTLLAQLQASEQRLARHVDDAVLVLAQAVLRRRPGAATVTPEPEAATPPAPVTDARVDTGEIPVVADHPVAPPEPAAAAEEDDVYATPEWGTRTTGSHRAIQVPDSDDDETMLEHLDAWTKGATAPATPTVPSARGEQAPPSSLWADDDPEPAATEVTAPRPAVDDGSIKRGLFRRRT